MDVNKPFSPIIRLRWIIVAIAFTVAAPVSGFFLTRIFLEARASAHWPAVPGVVTHAEVVPIGEIKRKYRTEVSYQYAVAGVDRQGSRIRTSDGEWDSLDAARSALGTLATDARVMVYYDPADPSRSVLEAGVGFQETALLIVPIFMLAIGVFAWWLLIRDLSRRNGPPPLPAHVSRPVRGRWN
jgi:Protein of unknown function (DUF3592)